MVIFQVAVDVANAFCHHKPCAVPNNVVATDSLLPVSQDGSPSGVSTDVQLSTKISTKFNPPKSTE